jgi:hypothetical protein
MIEAQAVALVGEPPDATEDRDQAPVPLASAIRNMMGSRYLTAWLGLDSGQDLPGSSCPAARPARLGRLRQGAGDRTWVIGNSVRLSYLFEGRASGHWGVDAEADDN